MRPHFDEGCEDCKEARMLWRLVLELSSRESAYYPADGAVRMAKAAYPGNESWRWLKRVAEFAQLKFDSALQPSPAMLRASRPGSRQLVHQAKPYIIDVRLESDPLHSTRTFLTGQILNSECPQESSCGIEVILLSGDQLLGRTIVSTTGEFQLELNREENVQLFINIRSQRAIGIDLPKLNR
jgi:hypothetical protein